MLGERFMAGVADPSRIELYTDTLAFSERVGIIRNYYELEFLGLNGQGFSGIFSFESAAFLCKFCEENPEFHIVSGVAPGRYVNTYEPGSRIYLLASGDPNPTLVLNHLISPDWQLINEDTISSALAELDKIKNRDQA
jgi:hypothetical protein